MILPNSRYSDSTVATVDKDGGDVAVLVPSAQQSHSFGFVNHQVAVGERIDSIAYQYYTDATMWWKIADANPELLWFDDIAVGTIIRVPLL